MAYVKTNEMTREQWLADRKTYLGASETAAILGFDKYRTPLDVYRMKRGEAEPETAGEKAEAGLRAEQMIAEWLADLYNLKIQRDNKIRIHPTLKFWRCNLDRVIIGQPNGTAPLELKTTSLENLKNWNPMAEELNPSFVHHWVQVQSQLAVTGYKWAAIGVMPADSFRGFGQPELIIIQPDQEFIAMATGKVEVFWEEHVLKGVPPDPVTEDDLKILYPRSQPKVFPVDESTCKLIIKIARMRAAKKKINDRLEEIELAIKMLLTDYEAATFDGEVVCTYKSAKDKEVFDEAKFKEKHPEESEQWIQKVLDVDFIKSEHPDLYNECLDPKPGSRSLIPKIKL
jgi:putative phage-type endonuclease